MRQRFLYRIDGRGKFDGPVRVAGREVELAFVVLDLEVRELEPVRRGDDDDLFGLVDLAGLDAVSSWRPGPRRCAGS